MSYSKENKGLLNKEQGGKAFSIMIAIYVLLSFVVQGILLAFVNENSFTYIAVCSCLSSTSIFLAFLYQNKCDKCTYKAMNIKKSQISSIFLALLLSAGMFLGLGFINIALIDLLQKVGITISSPNIPLNNLGQFIFFSLTLSILPAIFEELFFRGLFLNSLSEQSVLSKTLTVGLFFALYHCNLGQFIYQFIYGSALCLLTIYAKSIIPAMITHFLNNFVVLLFTYLKIQINLFSPILIAVGLVCLFLFLIAIILRLKKNNYSNHAEQNNKGIKEVFIPYGILGVIICSVMLISTLFM